MSQEAATHYVAYFAIERAVFRGRIPRRLDAVCGKTVDYPAGHSADPECQECKAWLQQEAEDDAEIAKANGIERM